MSLCIDGCHLLLFLSSCLVALLLSLVPLSGPCRLWFTVVFNSHVVFPCLIMIISWPWISLSCLSRSVIRLSWPSFCSQLTFLRLYDATIVSRMISWFLISFLLYFWWSCIFQHIPFIAYCRFIIRTPVDDNILEFSGLLIDIYSWHALLDYIFDGFTLVSMLSSSCGVLNLSWNSIFFDPICGV